MGRGVLGVPSWSGAQSSALLSKSPPLPAGLTQENVSMIIGMGKRIQPGNSGNCPIVQVFLSLKLQNMLKVKPWEGFMRKEVGCG